VTAPPEPVPPDVVVISGGVGAARFLRGLLLAVDDPHRITAVVNTGDDCVMHGLSISPDLDTIVYTLAEAIDPDRGWGLVDESWNAMSSLARYTAARPPGSQAAATWFNLGDRDLATHLYRTARLREGATLTAVTDEIRRSWDLPVRILPMTDDRLATVLTAEVDDGNGPDVVDVAFQDYFVRLRHDVPVRSVRFEGSAHPTPQALATLDAAAAIVVAPSNPLVSIGPVRALPGIDDVLVRRRDRVVAVSPIVGGAALKGPAARMLTELGHEPSVRGVARLYAPIASVLVVDPADEDLADAVEAEGMRCVVTPSVMSTPTLARDLARASLEALDGR